MGDGLQEEGYSARFFHCAVRVGCADSESFRERECYGGGGGGGGGGWWVKPVHRMEAGSVLGGGEGKDACELCEWTRHGVKKRWELVGGKGM